MYTDRYKLKVTLKFRSRNQQIKTQNLKSNVKLTNQKLEQPSQNQQNKSKIITLNVVTVDHCKAKRSKDG